MRILVVEDDEVAAEYVRKGLMEAGHVVDMAQSARKNVTPQSGVTREILT